MAIYFDNAATSYPKPAAVPDSVYHFMKHIGVNAGRGAYATARVAGDMIYEVRQLLCRLFNYGDPERVIFTSNITEALNLAIRGIVEPRGHVITSNIEHNAVWRCLKMLERDYDIEISTVSCDEDGIIDVEMIKTLVKPMTQLFVFNHASNVLGTIQPIREIGKIAKVHNIPFLVDCAQTAGVYPIDIEADCIDILAFTGHKGLLGPMGTGGLIVSYEGMIRPQKSGGTGRDSISPYQPNYLPDALEAGTLNVSGIIGLGAAVRFILDETVNAIRKKECFLTKYALEKMQDLDKAVIYGSGDSEKRVGVISFNLLGTTAAEVAYILDEVYGIMVRAGLHCAPNAHRLIGTEEIGTVRMSFGYFNEIKEIDEAVSALKQILSKL